MRIARVATTAVDAVAAHARSALTFLGPALLVSVGYVDPGNWATDLEAGSRFGYGLLWVLLASSLAAVLLQALSARLGIVAGMDLAQACRAGYSPRVNRTLWALAELGIVACDAAEVAGSAIALNMLFGLPLMLGAVLTGLDVFVVLAVQSRRSSNLHAGIAALLLVIAVCLAGEMLLARPAFGTLLRGFSPSLPRGALYPALGILGATLMPHNLYLQSALAKTGRAGGRAPALRASWLSTALALNLAFVLNVAILVLSARAFSSSAVPVTDLRDAHRLLAPLLGSSLASVLFTTGLLCAGQSATVTGTLAGQIVMEGFLKARLPPVLRRALTRGAAILPALAVLALLGGRGMMPLLVGSQVVLSLQLPFAILPLLRFTNCSDVMGAWASRAWLRAGAALCAAGVCLANGALLVKVFLDLRQVSVGSASAFVAACGAGVGFLIWVALVPLRFAREERVNAGFLAQVGGRTHMTRADVP